jgi:hypothetical protein
MELGTLSLTAMEHGKQITAAMVHTKHGPLSKATIEHACRTLMEMVIFI